MNDHTFQSWITDLTKEIETFRKVAVADFGTLFQLHKIGQNVLSLAASIKEDPEGLIFTNLMVYDPAKSLLRIILTHGFYYRNPFRRLFSIREGGHDEEGSCGVAFRSGEPRYVDDADEDPSVVWNRNIKKADEHIGSIINLPLNRLGVLNIDCREKKFFVPREMIMPRVNKIHEVALKFMRLYTESNPLTEQYRPFSLREGLDSSTPSQVLSDLALVERCLLLSAPEAAIIVCRRVVDRVAEHQGFKTSTTYGLTRALEDMANQGVIRQGNNQRLALLVKRANDVAHGNLPTNVEHQEAVDLFRILQRGLLEIYDKKLSS